VRGDGLRAGVGARRGITGATGRTSSARRW
jgi:hypothetical protein